MLQKPSSDNNRRQILNFLQRIFSFCLLLGITLSPLVGNQSLVNAQSGICTADFQPVSMPLTELGNTEYIRMDSQHTGFAGGLHPGGLNTRPAAHQVAAINAANAIVPLDATGNPDPAEGKIVMISIGMSNANYEFYTFMTRVQSDATINPQLLLINGALPGQTSEIWADPVSLPWQQLADTIAGYQVSPQQVQVALIKNTRTGGGDFPLKAQQIETDLEMTECLQEE